MHGSRHDGNPAKERVGWHDSQVAARYGADLRRRGSINSAADCPASSKRTPRAQRHNNSCFFFLLMCTESPLAHVHILPARGMFAIAFSDGDRAPGLQGRSPFLNMASMRMRCPAAARADFRGATRRITKVGESAVFARARRSSSAKGVRTAQLAP